MPNNGEIPVELLNQPDIAMAAVMLGNAKAEAARIFPGDDLQSVQKRIELIILILGQRSRNGNLGVDNGQSQTNREVSETQRS